MLHYTNIGEFVLKHILIFLLMIFYISSCATNENTYQTVYSGAKGHGKPECKGKNTKFWHNCGGGVYTTNGNIVFAEGIYMNGKREGKGWTRWNSLKCTVNMKNGLLDGWRECNDGTKSFYIAGKLQSSNKSSNTNKTNVSVNLTRLTNSVMNGWRADYKAEMGSLINGANCSSSVNLTALTNSVMNGWRADYKSEMGSLLSCTSCSSSVNLTTLTNSVMNGWRADYKNEMSSLISCASN